MCPRLARPYVGILPNLLALTRLSQSGLQSSYSTHLDAVQPVLDVRAVDESRTAFHSPNGLVTSRTGACTA